MTPYERMCADLMYLVWSTAGDSGCIVVEPKYDLNAKLEGDDVEHEDGTMNELGFNCCDCIFEADGFCRRFPQTVRVNTSHWCGEFKNELTIKNAPQKAATKD